jgi:uncharacterized spore protein YtfJ
VPERARRSDTLRVAAPIRVGDAIVLAIQRVAVRSERGARGVWVAAAAEPYAIVVRDADGARALELDGTAGSLEQLRERIPGLDDALG